MGKVRIERLIRSPGIRLLRTPRKDRYGVGKPAILAPNRLQRQLNMDARDRALVTDITHRRTWEGWLYMAVMLDLCSRQTNGWSMQPTLARELALDALLTGILAQGR
jgi:putative transposase